MLAEGLTIFISSLASALISGFSISSASTSTICLILSKELNKCDSAAEFDKIAPISFKAENLTFAFLLSE